MLRCHHEQHVFYCGLFTVTGLLVATVIFWLLLAPPRWLLPVFECSPLVGLGRISYALYLFHVPIIQWFHPRGPGLAAFALGLSVAAAVLSFYLVERPFVRAKQRRGPTPATGPDGPPVPTYRRVA